MFDKLKITLVVFFSLGISVFVANKLFRYFTYSKEPQVEVLGIKQDSYYAGIINCSILAQNGYKLDKVELFLDGQDINFDANKVSSKNFEIPFNIDTTDLDYGQHELNIVASDSSFNKNYIDRKIKFYVDNIPLKADFLQSDFKVYQGKTVYLKIHTNKKIKKADVRFLSQNYQCFLDHLEDSNIYEGFIPIDCEEKTGEFLITVNVVDFVDNSIKLNGKVKINQFNFPKQIGFKVSSKKLEDEKEVSMSPKILEKALEKWLKDSPQKKLWSGKFEIPTQVKWIATKYGEIRTTPERGRYYHTAIDIANTPKAVVWASQNGKIIIKDRYLTSGNTVVIDHGLGVFTLYFHLDDFADIEVGDFVKKGNPIGQIGMTGYATGYHLHWALKVGGVSVDPIEWTEKSFWT